MSRHQQPNRWDEHVTRAKPQNRPGGAPPSHPDRRAAGAGAPAARGRRVVLPGRRAGGRGRCGGRAGGCEQDEPVPPVFIEGRIGARLSWSARTSSFSAMSRRALPCIPASRPAASAIFRRSGGACLGRGLSRLPFRECRRWSFPDTSHRGTAIRRFATRHADGAAHRTAPRRRARTILSRLAQALGL